jgi:peptidoglycan-associated lipoprotein
MQMQKPRFLGLMSLLLAAFVLAGCSSTSTEPVPEPEPVAAPDPVQPAPTPEPVAQADFDGNIALGPDGQPLSRTFFFAYDKAVLKPGDLAALELHAQVLRRNANRSVVLEGHCDERGTREYNLALGERRANAVRSFLLSAGVSARQVETVSYGEEQPSDPGHSEAAWQRNRRAVMAYQ